MAGFGPGSDWLRNLEVGGGVKVETGGQSYVPEFRVLDAREGAAVLADYERRNRLLQPLIRVVLSRLAGWRYDQTSAARLRLAAELPLLALYPTSMRDNGAGAALTTLARCCCIYRIRTACNGDRWARSLS